MIRKAENYKKGEIVYVHCTDTRYNGYNAIITSVGNKYITAMRYDNDGNTWGNKIKFDVENSRNTEWCSYELYHSKDECDEFNKRQNMINEFYRIASRRGFKDNDVINFMQTYSNTKE